jgi:hypothetical protein
MSTSDTSGSSGSSPVCSEPTECAVERMATEWLEQILADTRQAYQAALDKLPTAVFSDKVWEQFEERQAILFYGFLPEGIATLEAALGSDPEIEFEFFGELYQQTLALENDAEVAGIHALAKKEWQRRGGPLLVQEPAPAPGVPPPWMAL